MGTPACRGRSSRLGLKVVVMVGSDRRRGCGRLPVGGGRTLRWRLVVSGGGYEIGEGLAKGGCRCRWGGRPEAIKRLPVPAAAGAAGRG